MKRTFQRPRPGVTKNKCFSSPSVAGATISKRRNCLFRLKKPIRPVPALPAYAYQEANSLVLAWIVHHPQHVGERVEVLRLDRCIGLAPIWTVRSLARGHRRKPFLG